MADLMPYRQTSVRREILLPAPRRSAEDVRVVHVGGVSAPPKRSLAELVAGLGQLGQGLRSTLFRLRHRPTRSRVARIICFVPAHNEEADLARTLDGLMAQTRRIDRIVVIIDNCTDNTEAIARRYRGVTVMRTVGNQDKKVGALNQAWHQYARGYDFLLGVDADTVLAPDCVAQLEDEMVRKPNVAGIMARYTFDERLATTWWARQLIRAQRLDFAQWLMEIGRRPDRETYVLGGQATLFRIGHLDEVVRQHERFGPWDPSAQVEDMELTWRLNEQGRRTLTSEAARAYAGPMITVKALLGQRRKWDEGMIRLLLSHSMSERNTWLPWRQNLALLTDGLLRVMLVLLLLAAVMVDQFVWSWWWAIPPVLAAALNVRVAWYVPGRKLGDLMFGLLMVPAEMWLLFRIYSTGASWGSVLFGRKRDGWAAQAAAERGTGSNLLGRFLLAGVGIAVTNGLFVYWWLALAGPVVQQKILTVGWGALAILTIVRTGSVVLKLCKPSRGYRP